METIICKICGKEKKVKPYLKNKQIYCSAKCKGVDDAKRMKGNKCGTGHIPWNKNKKGIHLSPQSEFKKGLVPWNKYVRGIHFSPKTEFKKGIVPENKLPIGSIQIREGHDGHKRKWIKIAEPNKWMTQARYIYSQYEEIVSGNVIHHSDRNTLNDDPENLEQLTRAEHMERHRDQLR